MLEAKIKPCSYCGEPAVLTAGKSYCQQHIWIVDTPSIGQMLPTHNFGLQNAFFNEAFGTCNPTFAMFPLLYNQFPVERGEWVKRLKRFTKSQEIYISECFIEWMKE